MNKFYLVLEGYEVVAVPESEAENNKPCDTVVVMKFDTVALQLSVWNYDSEEWEVVEWVE